MRLLLDTHTLIWAVDDPLQIPSVAMIAMADSANDRLVSTATIWEMAIKFSKGRLPLSLPYRPWMNKAIADLALTVLPITLDHIERQSELSWHHRVRSTDCWQHRPSLKASRSSAPIPFSISMG